MKRALLVSFFYPPRPGIGSLRPAGLVKFLPEFGWDCLVLTATTDTAPYEAGNVTATAYVDRVAAVKQMLGLRGDEGAQQQLSSGLGERRQGTFRDRMVAGVAQGVRKVLTFPDDAYGWYKPGLTAARELLRREKIDLIVSSSFPVTCHLLAKQLAKEFGLPWVADLRDLWSQNHYLGSPGLIMKLHRHLEVRTFKHAVALTTVSRPLAETLGLLHPVAKVETIMNGYDPDDYPPLEPTGHSQRFIISYTGSLYDGKRDPIPLFEAVQGLIEEGVITHKDIEIDFYGDTGSWLREYIVKYELESVVKLHGTVSRKQAIRVQQQSDILLLLLWDHPMEAGVVTGKLFEYLGARRTVLAYGGPGGVVATLLDQTGAGRFVHGVSGIKQFLREALDRWCADHGLVYQGDSDRVDKYTHREMARQFANLFDAMVAAKEKRLKAKGEGNFDS